MAWLRCCFALAWLVFSGATAALTLQFEGLSDGTPLLSQFPGLHFSHATVLTAGIGLNELEFPPASGTNVVFDDGGPLLIAFDSPMTHFSAFFTHAVPLRIAAQDAQGHELEFVQSVFASNLALSGDPGSTPNTLFSLSVGAGFSRVLISGDSAGTSFAMDDLSVSAVPEPASLILILAGGGLLMWRLRKRAVMAVLLILGSGLAAAQPIAPLVALPLTAPLALHVATPTAVRVSVLVRAANVLPGGVNVLRVDANGSTTVLGSLNDNGVSGDLQAGDGVYGGNLLLNESAEGNVRLRASVAVRGSLRRLVSADALLPVLPAQAPLTLQVRDPSHSTTDAASGAEVASDTVNACFGMGIGYAAVVAVAGRVGANPIGRFPGSGNCYQLDIPVSDSAALAALIAQLAKQPEVQSAEGEPIVRGACSGPICNDPNYRIVLKLPSAQLLGRGSTAVQVAVLDTGLDAALIPSANFTAVNLGGNYSSSGTVGIPRDDHGHGTLVTHIVHESAPDASVLVIKVLNAHNACTEASSGLGLAEAVQAGARVVNMSLSGRLQTAAMRDLLDQVQNAGLLIVAAAGNSNSSVREYPAAHVGVIAVGNTDASDVRAADSNHGNWVNLAAPGVNVAGLGSGTSLSAPFVSAAAAMIWAKFPTLTHEEVRKQLLTTTMPIPFIAGKDTCPAQPCNQDLGSGRLDVEAALGAIRFKRVTAVGAAGAKIARDIEITLTRVGGATVMGTTVLSFKGQSTGCEVATVINPPCLANLPFDFAALPAGNYNLRMRFADPTASFFGSVQLNTPNAHFTSVVSGTGGIHADDDHQADFSLFGFGVQSTTLAIQKN